MKQLYVIAYSSAHWCGAPNHCLAWADDEDEAKLKAEQHMEEDMRELYSYEHESEPELDDECAYTVETVELLKGHEYELYYRDEICVNEYENPNGK